MTNDPHSRLGDRGVGVTEARRRWAQSLAYQLARNLEGFRDELHRRLDELESLIRRRVELEYADRERALRARVAELEKAQAKMQGEVGSLNDQHVELMARLEHDRQLLAEAWQRLEEERSQSRRGDSGGAGGSVSGSGSGSTGSRVGLPGRHRTGVGAAPGTGGAPSIPAPAAAAPVAVPASIPAATPAPVAVPVPVPVAESTSAAEGVDAAASSAALRAIRRQFEALQKDVRRNT